METTPTPPRSVLYRAYFICLILILSQINSLFSQGGSMDGIIFGAPVGSNLLIDCGGGPCDAERWTGGAAWNAACPNSSCLIDDGPSANGGIVRCGNSAETQSNIQPNSCYDPAVFTASVSGTCFDPNTGTPVSITLPLIDQQVLWFNFDVRAFAGGYDFQVIGGNEDIAWILYYSNNPQCCVGGFNPGLSGNCNSLTSYACGTSFNNWAAQSFTTPIFDLTTNVYLLVWDQGFSKGDVSSDDFSINFKARYGCGESCSFLTNGQPVITCQPNGNYTVLQNVVGTSTTVTVTAPGSLSIVTNPSPLVFTDLDPGPPPNVNSGTVTVTYANGVNYNITMTPTGTGATCNPITLSGTAPVCCVPPTCTITGPTPVCPSSTNVYCGPVGAAAYSWSVTGGGTINGATNEQCVTVTSSSACSTTYTLTLLAGAPGCESTCNYTVTVSDTSVPSITCPANVTIQCSASSAPGGANGTATATDNCTPNDNITITSSDVTAAGACPQAYTITRTWRATDQCGNSSTCNQILQVVDTTPPTISCPSDLTVSCANQVPTPNSANASASDNCSTPVITFESDVTTNQTCVNQYTITRTYRATDGCNNSATCIQTIVVNDQTPPSIMCPPAITVQCASQVPAPVVGSVITNDNCTGPAPIVTFVGDVTTNQTCINRYTLTRTYRATDACNNSATCTQVITVNDQTPPTVNCPSPVTVSCFEQVPAPNPGSVTTSDNCGGSPSVVFVSDVTINQLCPNQYFFVRTYRSTDACGNSATCSQTITVNDQTPPTLTCPLPVTVSCASEVPAPNTGSVTASDNCNGTPTITFVNDVTTNQTCANRYTLTRTYRATDACNNSATCTQTITVNDQTVPSITCPAPVTVTCASQIPAPNTTSVTSSDNCGGNVTIAHLGDVTINMTCANRFMVTRTYRATDACFNTATCTQVITVFDGTPPTITCPPAVTVTCASQVPAPNTASVTASDNCNGTPTITFVNDVTTNQSCVNRYTITRTYRATDECQNSSTCTQTITVFDNTLPSITCPANTTVECAALVPAPNPASVTSTDNCGGVPLVTFINDVTISQTCINRYTIIRTYQASDGCNNTATCTQSIVVNDQTPPTITCPPPVTVSCASLVPAPNTGSVTTSDNCNGVPSVVFVNDVTTNQTCINRYTLTRTYRATDECGNSSTCTQTITVNDLTPPTINCPANLTFSCATQVPAPNIAAVTASDNCNGIPTVVFVNDVTTNQTCANRYILTRTYRATDECGNSATCTQVITINDQSAPTLTCPPGLTVTCSSDVPPANPGLVTATDDCNGIPAITFVGDVTSNQTCLHRYTVIRTYRATDDCGNSATCTQTIIVNDQVPPELTCPSNITVTCQEQIPAANPQQVTATDNCVGPVIITFVSDVNTNQECANRYTLVRTFRATDDCGNSATCSQLIFVNDQTPPSLTCPPPVTVSCANEVPAPNSENIPRSDNCDAPVAVIFVGDVTTNQTCANRYTLTRTYRATDACDNSATCTQVITVFDNTPPQIECPDDITVNPESSTLPIVTGSPTGSDNCGETPEFTYADVTTAGPCITDYFIDRTWTAMDACGNSSTCLQEIAVQGGCVVDLALDKSLAVGQDININPGDDITFTIRISNNGNVFIGSVSIVDYIPLGFTLNDPDWIGGTAGSTGQSASIELSVANGLLPLIGLAPGAFVDVDITLKSDDNLSGGTYTNTAEISAMRNLAGMDVSNSDIDSDPDTDDTNDPPAEDDIDPLVFCIIIDPVIIGEDMVCQGDTTTYTVESFNPDHTYNWSVGAGGIIISSTDSSITVLWTADPGTLITIELLEIAGEECQFSAVFDVIIGGAEAIACFDHINLSIANDCGTEILSGMILTGIQHGDNSYQVFVIDMTTGDTIPNATVNCTHVGKTFKVSVRSKCTGQSCWGLVTIEDKSPPIINCVCPAGEEPNERCRLSCLVVDQLLNGIIPDNVRPQVVDECCGTTLELTNVDLSFADCSNGYVEISWQATDAFGNTATCVQAFDVVPLNIAGIIWPKDYLGDCNDSDDPENTGFPQLNGINLISVVASCNIWTQYDDQVVPICGDGRKIIRRWTITNMCNAQSDNYIQTIVLKDRVGPVLTCAPDNTVTTDVWACDADIIMPKPLAVDACSDVTTFQLFSSGGTVVETGGQFRINNLPIGDHQVTWVVTDECYNQSTCGILITVRDNVPPVVSCQAHTIVSLTNDRPNGITLVPASAFDAGSFDNCSPVTIGVRRMTSCIDIDWTTYGACIDDTLNGLIDEYDQGTVPFLHCIPVSCCDVGTTFMVQLAVWDDSDNVNYCMVEVEVQDKLEPVLTCPPILEISCEFPIDVQEGTFRDAEGNNDGSLDEDPLSEIFGNIYDASRHQQSERQPVIINDPDNNQLNQPYNWGLEGWATDNCELELSSTVSVVEDCSGNSFPSFAPEHTVKIIDRRIFASDGVNTSSCIQRIWVVDYSPFFIADTTCENENPDDGVIWPCDVLITDCPEEISGTGEPIILDDACSIIGISHEDTQYDFAEGACFKILREWKVIDWCQFDVNTGYGIWSYTQTIKVADQVGPEYLDCPAEPVSYCTDDPGITLPANNQLFLGENNPDASSCSVHVNLHQTVRELCSPEVIYDVKLYLFNGPDFIQIKQETIASVNANHEADLYFDTEESGIPSIVLNGLPYNDPFCEDYHRLLWSVEDGCGNRTYCDYLFRLEDCKKPTPVCIDGISAAVMGPNGEVTVFAANFNASSVDDCTPSDGLLFSFSWNTYQPSFTYTCDNVPVIGTPFDIEMWAADGGSDINCNGIIEWSERNKDFCTASLLITDPNGVCDENGLVLTGEIMTDHVDAVSDVSVKLSGPESNAPVYVTQEDGIYTFTGVKEGLDYNISAERNDDPKNGVSTLDLVAIQKHLLGLETFTSASQYIAADASNNGSVSAIDLIEIRKLILGLYDQYPDNQSWRFVKKEVAENPGSPWPLTEIISIYSLEASENTSFDFVGIKVGDVNNTAKAHLTQIMPRNARPVMMVSAVVNEEIRKGRVIDCKLTIPRVVEGFQWTLETEGLEYLGIKSTTIPIDDSHIGVLENGVLTMSWNGTPVQEDGDQQSISFILQFRVNQEGQLKDMLKMNSSVTLAEAYTQHGEVLEPKLEIDEKGMFTDFALYQNKPNPWDDQTLIEFDLPFDGPAKLTVYDVAGKVVKQVEAEFKAGHNFIMLTERDIPTPGVLYYRLDSGEFSAVKKMMIFH